MQPRWVQEWWYRWFGPTQVHLRYEFFLLCSIMLLTIGSMSGLYKGSFGSYAGDYKFLLLMFVVSSRHLLFRMACTWDPSTHASPGICGLVSQFVQSYVTGGQVFDRPMPPIQQQQHNLHYAAMHNTSEHHKMSGMSGNHPISSSLTSSSSSAANTLSSPPPAAADRMTQMVGHIVENKDATTWYQLIPSCWVYAWQIPRRYIWFPLSRFLMYSLTMSSPQPYRDADDDNDNNSTGRVRYSRSTDPLRSNWLRRGWKSFQQYFVQSWMRNCPSVQFSLAIIVLFYYTSRLWLYMTGQPPILLVKALLEGNLPLARQLSDLSDNRTAGIYNRYTQPPDIEMLLIMLGFGTLISSLWVSRIVLPLPDLVAGGNVSRDVARSQCLASAPGGNGIAKSKKSAAKSGSTVGLYSRMQQYYMDHMHSQLTGQKSASASEMAVFTERQYSIASENRWKLSLYVIYARMFENILLVGVFPRTNFVCRATGHCPAGPPLWELSRILYPGGYYQPKRPNNDDKFGYMESDISSAIWAAVGVAIVTFVLLLAQTTVLDRSYLSALAYHSLEWELHDSKKQNSLSLSSSPSSTNAHHPQQHSIRVWDPNRKYAKGDMVYYPESTGVVFRATVDAPKSRPQDRRSRGRTLKDRFVHEVGHPSTSTLLGELAVYELLIALLHFAVWIWLLALGYSFYTHGLGWAVAAHFVATHGVVANIAPQSIWSAKWPFQTSDSLLSLRELNAEITK